jgi:hypothetical protein
MLGRRICERARKIAEVASSSGHGWSCHWVCMEMSWGFSALHTMAGHLGAFSKQA